MDLQDAVTLERLPKIKCDNCKRWMNRRIEDKLHDANGKVRWLRWCGRARRQAAKRHWLAQRNGKMGASKKNSTPQVHSARESSSKLRKSHQPSSAQRS
jgi:hypothetical protein